MEYKKEIHQLDEHNDDLLNLTSMLNKAVQSCRRKELNLVIQFLENFANDTFQDKETLSQDHDYISHYLDKAEHEKFKSLVTDLRTLYDSNKPAAHLIFFIRKNIDQLIHHIQTISTDIQDLAQSIDASINPHDTFEAYLKQNDSRYTKTKRFITDEIFNLTDHFEVENFIDHLRSKTKDISRATVYRTIKQLLDANLLQKISTLDGKVFYEQSQTQRQHAHIICNNCGKINEIHDDTLYHLIDTYCKSINFTMTYQSIHIYGTCKPDCCETKTL
ncbi:hypothetical protein CL658_04970 [bacterium]|nr:hypothetical protein [bacterium]|tara:strand:+ start:858 stop:1682 length:825 start_codon:yes stop_codon:yes gene_type:complete